MGSLTKATTETFAQGGVNSTNINNEAITNAKIASNAAIANSKLSITFPTISSLSITNGQPAVYDTETVDINGTDFTNGARVDFIHSTTNAVLNLPTVTFVSATQLRVTVPASTLTEGTDYKIRVTNPDGLAATSTGTVLYSQTVSFSTSSGSLGSVGEGESASFSVSASSNSSITYSITSGSLPSGLSLNSSTGAITGTAPTVSADTTSTFTITATDAESQTASRSFSITVTNFVIANSLRFNDDDSPTLSITPSSTGNRKTWTFSYWIKRANISTVQQTFSVGTNTSTPWFLNYINSDDTLHAWFHDGSNSYLSTTSNKLRDTSAWYHIMYVVDTTQATAADRFKIYINSVEATWNSYSAPSQNFDTEVNTTSTHYIGRAGNGQYFDGYIAEAHFIDGTAKSPTDFGETDSTTNNWIPKKYTGTYGTNGFYLDFSDSSNLGADSSGNSNTFTASNLAAADQTTDTPTNNFATLNPLNALNSTFREGNTESVRTTASAAATVSTLAPSTGKWYLEFKNSANQNSSIGLLNLDEWASTTDPYPFATAAAHLIESTRNSVLQYSNVASDGDVVIQNSVQLNSAKYGMAYDLDNGNVYFSANGSWYSSVSGAFDKANFSDATAVLTSIPTNTPMAFFARGSFVSDYYVNFGNPGGDDTISSGNSDENGYGNFEYAVPSGYLALCTNNLPNVTIADPTAHFNTVLYTGDGTTNRTISGVGFQPDFTWLKRRSSAYSHALLDSNRGGGKSLSSDNTDAENTNNNILSSWNSDGFVIALSGVSAFSNTSGQTYVGWNWLANGGTTSSNTDGSITSTVQANTTAGFSIVTYTGTGANATIGHGLGIVPKMIICKQRNNTLGHDWLVYHEGIGNTKYIPLSSTQAATTASTAWQNTTPTSSVFSVGTSASVNESGKNQLAYCFAEIEGYSKFGSYTGNGSADGTFIYTGFKPAFVIFRRTDSTNNWNMFDNKRDIDNQVGNVLYSNLSDAEQDDSLHSSGNDFLSNGFKLRETGNAINGSGASYIYMAFAEAPFKYGTGATTVEGTAR